MHTYIHTCIIPSSIHLCIGRGICRCNLDLRAYDSYGSTLYTYVCTYILMYVYRCRNYVKILGIVVPVL